MFTFANDRGGASGSTSCVSQEARQGSGCYTPRELPNLPAATTRPEAYDGTQLACVAEDGRCLGAFGGGHVLEQWPIPANMVSVPLLGRDPDVIHPGNGLPWILVMAAEICR